MSNKRPHDTSFKIAPRSTVFRLLCPTSKDGSLIGMHGHNISHICQSSGAKVTVEEFIPGCKERVVVIAEDNQLRNSQSKNADEETQSERVTPSIQKGLFIVFDQMFQGEPTINGGGEDGCVVRLLVPSSQVGCISGEAGSVMEQLAYKSGSRILVLPKDKLPACAASYDELMIQLSGDIHAVRKALQSVSQRLLGHPPRENESFSANPSGSHSFMNQHPSAPFPPLRRRKLSPGRYSSFNNFDAGIPPHDEFHPRDDHPPFMHHYGPSFGHHMPERFAPSGSWGPQGVDSGVPSGFPQSSERRLGGFAGGDHAVILSTTVEVIVPCSALPELCTDDGDCLKLISEISDAKIIINDAQPGAKETLTIISGTPDQTQAAFSLIQAFVYEAEKSDRK